MLCAADCKDQASSLASLVEELSEDADSVLPTTQESMTSSLLNNLTSSQKDMTGDSNLTNGHLLNRERVTSSESGSRSKLSLKGSTDGGSKGQLSTEKLTDRLRRFRDGGFNVFIFTTFFSRNGSITMTRQEVPKRW